MKKTGVVLALLILILVISLATTTLAKEIEMSLNDINKKVSAKAVGLDMDMKSGEITISTKSPNYNDTTTLKGKNDYSMIARKGELTQLDKNVDGSFKGVTKLDNGKFAVEFKGKAKHIFKQLLLKKAKDGKVSVLIKGNGKGQVIIVVPGGGKKKKKKKREPPTYTKWEIREMQLSRFLDISPNEAWDIVHEYLLLKTRYALEHTPKGPDVDAKKSRWFFWLYLLKPKFRGGVENNKVFAQFFHPKTKQPLKDLKVNVSVRDLEGDLGLVYASPMPYYSKKKLYLENLKKSKHWLIALRSLKPGDYMLHIDVGDGLRKFVKIPIVITDKHNIVEDNGKGSVGVELKSESGKVEKVKISFTNTTDKEMSLNPAMRILRNGKLLKNVFLKSFEISPDQQLSNQIPLKAILSRTLSSGEYKVKLRFETDSGVLTTESKFTVS